MRPAFLPLLDTWRAQVAAGETPTNLLERSGLPRYPAGGYRATEGWRSCEDDASGRGGHADAYVLTTLLLASALFFAGVTTSFRVRFAQILLLFGATLMIGYARVATRRSPVA